MTKQDALIQAHKESGIGTDPINLSEYIEKIVFRAMEIYAESSFDAGRDWVGFCDCDFMYDNYKDWISKQQ